MRFTDLDKKHGLHTQSVIGGLKHVATKFQSNLTISKISFFHAFFILYSFVLRMSHSYLFIWSSLHFHAVDFDPLSMAARVC